jgi:hypothetical protein
MNNPNQMIDMLLNKIFGYADQLFAWFNRMFFSGDAKRMDLLFVLVVAFFATKIFKFKFNVGGKK